MRICPEFEKLEKRHWLLELAIVLLAISNICYGISSCQKKEPPVQNPPATQTFDPATMNSTPITEVR